MAIQSSNGTEYVVLCGQMVGSGPFSKEYSFDGQRFEHRKDAIAHGLGKGRSDDFNIGVVENGKLVRLDWMEDPVDTDPAIIDPIAKQVGLTGR